MSSRGKTDRRWAAYFAFFCGFEIVATVAGVKQDYWTKWVTGVAIIWFAVLAGLAWTGRLR